MRKAIHSTRAARVHRRGGSRRGVLLLIVLSLLAMFALIGLTFVILTNHARRSAETAGRAEQYVKGPEDKAEMVLMQCIRGANNPASVLRNHGLLEDLYGAPLFRLSPVVNAVGACQNAGGQYFGQLVNLYFTPAVLSLKNARSCCGCVLTFTAGPLTGQSVRVVGAGEQVLGGNTFTYLQVANLDKINVHLASGQVSIVNGLVFNDASYRHEVLINGVAFSGTGFGYYYDPTAPPPPADDPQLKAVDPTYGLLYALTPNPVGFVIGFDANYSDPSGPGGANEDYDAADYQNMLLAMQLPYADVINGHPEPAGTTPIPSLHRPSLIRYWIASSLGSTPATPEQWKTAFDSLNVNLRRRISLRPLQADHLNFTGSNPKYNPTWDGLYVDNLPDNPNPQPDGDGVCDYAWDVDNDGDGVSDSIWVDAGLPVQSTKEGVLYKPLVAILCVDLDGRVNLNAHGCRVQADTTNYQTPQAITANIVTGSVNSLNVPRGQGVGPAEVNLLAVLNDIMPGGPTAATQYVSLLAGRYGAMVMPGVAGVNGDPLAVNKMFDFPFPVVYNYDYLANPLNPENTRSYGTPMDLNGGMALGLDLRGQPLYAPFTPGAAPWNAYGLLLYDNPYEFNLSSKSRGAADAPFTPNELEALLRWYDIDAGTLPGRLLALAPSLKRNDLAGIPGARGEVTTESWSVPCPAVALPPELRADAAAFAAVSNGRAGHLVDLLRAKLFKENTLLVPTNPAHVQTVDSMMSYLLAAESFAGLRFDLNRLFGNGVDDATPAVPGNPGQRVIDEPSKVVRNPVSGIYALDTTLAGETMVDLMPQFDSSGGLIAGINFNHANGVDVNNDGVVNAVDNALVRQLYARHLYVKMLLLMNYRVVSPVAPTQAEKDTARQVAQWAVNIVDFRDRDSIMTPFEYDVDPFRDSNSDGNPWDVDGVIGGGSPDDAASHRGLVWGCERPELLITETLAWHDQKAEDTDEETPPDGTKQDDPNDPDMDYDQKLKPEGALFVEVYNPSTTNEPLSGEFYAATQQLRLNAMIDNTPVWRLIVVAGDGRPKDLDDPDDPPDAADIVRSIYFVNGLNPGLDLGSDGTRFLAEATIAPLLPDRYAVIGPGTATSGETYAGQRIDADLTTRRRVVLTPDNDPDQTGQVSILNNGKTAPTVDMPATLIKPPIAIRVPNLNVSEPLAGDPDAYQSLVDAGGAAVVHDRPFDYDRDEMFSQPGTTAGAFVIHLQRLANPLIGYDADTNPYRTVDTMPIDLTTFNGAEANRDTALGPKNKRTRFESNQRGDVETTDVAVAGVFNLWAQPSKPKPMTADSQQETPVVHKFPFVLGHSLGYLTDDFGPPQAGPVDASATPPYDYRGMPQQPFPWLTWLNRPFTSAGELTLVPKWRSSLLLKGASVGSPASNPYKNPGQPFGHLLNFWYDDTTAHPLTATPNWKLHRLLEFVHVPSRFVGTELQGSPSHFTGGAHAFHPPFNRISNYREPGKVNLNTITSRRVWQGLLGGIASPTFDQFVASRRASTAGTGWDLDPTLPTRFANPFRSFAGKYLVPLPTLQTQIGEEINATMLRPVTASGNATLFNFTSTQPVNDTNRNPAFRNQLLGRLDNVATNRSNVYAIWITVGYFEAEPWVQVAVIAGQPVNDQGLTHDQFLQIHPDGYRLGRELGSDTGEATRHRAFYIIDRSIPVGFQRGEDLNTRDTILLRRNIE